MRVYRVLVKDLTQIKKTSLYLFSHMRDVKSCLRLDSLCPNLVSW